LSKKPLEVEATMIGVFEVTPVFKGRLPLAKNVEIELKLA
jgi:hypothetical protein